MAGRSSASAAARLRVLHEDGELQSHPDTDQRKAGLYYESCILHFRLSYSAVGCRYCLTERLPDVIRRVPNRSQLEVIDKNLQDTRAYEGRK